jgi:hypothetical protein
MAQSIDEVLDDLRSFVAGRGREDNFLYSEDKAKCADFSTWVALRLIKNDIFALAVFRAQLDRDFSDTEYYTVNVFDTDEELDVEEESDEPIEQVSLEREVKHQEQEINHLLSFPFEEYFSGDIRSAKTDLLVAWLLGYYGEGFTEAMMPYDLRIKDAKTYLDNYNQTRNKKFQLPSDLPSNSTINEFRSELRKLPLATRLHLFDVFEYSGVWKKPKRLSEMVYTAREVGIDEEQSAKILQHSKLITSFPDGTGFVSPEYRDAISVAFDYAKKFTPVYKDWWLNVTNSIEDKWGVYVYGTDIEEDGYVTEENAEKDTEDFKEWIRRNYGK